MKDEIKEILDDLDYCRNRNCGSILLNCKECNELLNYITNLQEDLQVWKSLVNKKWEG